MNRQFSNKKCKFDVDLIFAILEMENCNVHIIWKAILSKPIQKNLLVLKNLFVFFSYKQPGC